MNLLVTTDESANEDDGSCIFMKCGELLGNCVNDTDQDQVCDEEDNCIDVINPSSDRLR